MKGRPKSKPLIVHVESELAIDVFAVDVPEYVHKLAAAFWPGPLTLVVKRSAEVPDVVTGGGDTVALRAPDHPIALELLAVLSRSLNRPAGIAAPSANRFGETPAVTAAEVIEAFGGVGTDVDVPDLLLDGGLCPKGVPSTVLSCVGETPRLLRRGTIGVEEIERVIGCSVDSSGA
jgi:L-threonylcarbamoyladenylate synthase